MCRLVTERAAGNNQDRMHSVVNPFQEASWSVGLVSDRYLFCCAQGGCNSVAREERIEAQRKLTENWMKAENMPGFFR